MKKMILALFAVFMLTLTVTGCGSKTETVTTNTHQNSDEVLNIAVVTNGFPVIIEPTGGNEITTAISGDEKVNATQSGSTLTIEMAEPSGGLSFSSVPTLTIGVPQKNYRTLSVSGSSESISIQDVDADTVDINIDFGDVFVTDMAGTVSAQTGMGVITVDGQEISTSEEDTFIVKYNGQYGSDTSKTINIRTEFGDVKIQGNAS